MKRAVLLVWLLLLGGTLVRAQQGASTAQGSGQSQPDTRSTQQTVRGCLSGTGTSFSLTEASGKSWQLHGDATVLNRMKEQVGHEVVVTGTPSNASASAEPVARENSGTADNLSTLLVTNVEQIAETCSSSGGPGAATASTGAGGATGAATATASAPAAAAPGSAVGETAQEAGSPPPGSPPPITSETPARSVSPTGSAPDVSGARAYGTPRGATSTPARSEAKRPSGTPRVIDDRDF